MKRAWKIKWKTVCAIWRTFLWGFLGSKILMTLLGLDILQISLEVKRKMTKGLRKCQVGERIEKKYYIILN